MLHRSVRFMLSFLLGLGLGSAALVMAGYLNIWKLNWQAAYAIVESRLYLPQTQTVILPTTPLALIPILYNASLDPSRGPKNIFHNALLASYSRGCS